MAQIISNISEISNSVPEENVKVLSFTEELLKIEKIKHNLSLLYFAGFAILLTTLFI